jgi:hypothetical protein
LIADFERLNKSDPKLFIEDISEEGADDQSIMSVK